MENKNNLVNKSNKSQDLIKILLKKLETEMELQDFTWIKQSDFVLQTSNSSQKLIIYSENNFNQSWVIKFSDFIKQSLFELVPNNTPIIDFVLKNDYKNHDEQPNFFKEELTKKASKKPTNNQQQIDYAKSTNLNKIYKFSNLIQGKANELVVSAAKIVAESETVKYNPLFVYGGVGLGKTHILHAIGNEYLKNFPFKKVYYFTTESFIRRWVEALRSKTYEDFKNHFRSMDLILVDDIQFIAKKINTQEEFFHTFNSLRENFKQIILASDRYPTNIKQLENRLITRFTNGLTLEIEPPELEMRIAILMDKAQQKNWFLPLDVAGYMAERLGSNIRDLEGCLNKLFTYVNYYKKPVTIETTKKALKDVLIINNKLVSMENIQECVAKYFNIKVRDIKSNRRTKNIAKPRQIAMFLARDLTKHSFPEIGEAFGGKDHTTVMHACKAIVKQRMDDYSIDEDLKNLSKLIRS